MKKADIVLISILICVFLVFFGVYLFSDTNNDDILIIQQDQKIIYKESIYKDNEIEIRNESGAITNIVTVKEGKVYMSYADCANKDCIHMGELTAGSKKQIACLPNKILVYLVSAKQIIDGITR
ncbi:MAG: NusG domain II-containing protein [Clostridia bacterium]|jgi:hypothetical protein